MEVTKFVKSQKEGALIAFFNLKYNVKIEAYGSLIVATQYVNDMKLFQKNGRKWVSFPDKRYEKDGQPQYIPYLGFVERNDEFVSAVLKAIDDFCIKAAQQPVRAMEVNPQPQSMDECPF